MCKQSIFEMPCCEELDNKCFVSVTIREYICLEKTECMHGHGAALFSLVYHACIEEHI